MAARRAAAGSRRRAPRPARAPRSSAAAAPASLIGATASAARARRRRGSRWRRCPGPAPGTHASSGIASEMRAPRPSRRSPAAASTSARTRRRRAFASRVSTLPRIGAKRAPGSSRVSCAMRRTLPVPIAASRRGAPSCDRRELSDRDPRAVSTMQPAAAPARRADLRAAAPRRCRARRAASPACPCCCAPRGRFAAQQRVFDFLHEQPLAADFRERRVLQPIAGRPDDDDLHARAAGSAMRAATVRACHSASWLPRVPSRSLRWASWTDRSAESPRRVRR